MAEQLWKGRFSKAVDSRVNDFNSSIRFDQRMIAQDMRGSGVHATMLAKVGVLTAEERDAIEAEPIEMEFGEPILTIREQEMYNLVFAIIEAETIPCRMLTT